MPSERLSFIMVATLIVLVVVFYGWMGYEIFSGHPVCATVPK